MDRSIKCLTYIGFCLWAFIFFRCSDEPTSNDRSKTTTITIAELGEHQVFTIPNACNGWQRRSSYLIENTANDSIRIRDKIIAPGQIGRLYSLDVFEDRDSFEYHYWPYKATSGKIIIKIAVSDCDQN